MANTKPKNASQKSFANTSDPNIRDSIYATRFADKDRLLFKSFDFSNIAIFGGDENHRTSDADYRRFHQMTMYIQVPAVYSHDERRALGGETLLITSNLPETVSYDIGSEWAEPLGSFGNATTNLLMQMAGNQLDADLGSGVTRATTMRIWTKTKPLTMSLKIPVIDDGETASGTNLVEALEILGSLTLPTVGGLGFYNPPPSPLRASIKYATHLDEAGNPVASDKPWNFSTNNPSRIMVQLGGLLLVDYCVIESFSVEYPSTKTMIRHDYTGIKGVDFGKTGQTYLHPLLANVNIKISTIEAITADTYSKMLWAKGQPNVGAGTFDVSKGPLGYISAGVVQAGRIVKKGIGAVSSALGGGS